MDKPDWIIRNDILCERLRQVTEPRKNFGKIVVEMTDKKMTRAIKTSLNSNKKQL